MKPIKPTSELERELISALAEQVLENKRLRDVVEAFKQREGNRHVIYGNMANMQAQHSNPQHDYQHRPQDAKVKNIDPPNNNEPGLTKAVIDESQREHDKTVQQMNDNRSVLIKNGNENYRNMFYNPYYKGMLDGHGHV